MGEFVERVAAEAVAVKPWRVAVTVLAVPFWLLGALAGLVWVVAVFAYGAAQVGFADARARLVPAGDGGQVDRSEGG
jgi:hypothetical protein